MAVFNAELVAATPSFVGPFSSSGDSIFYGRVDLEEIRETVSSISASADLVTCNYTSACVFYLANSTGITKNYTVDAINVPTDDGYAITISIIVNQGATGYYPGVFKINGTTENVKWVNDTAPSVNANKIDIYNFTLIRVSNAWIVLGSASNNYDTIQVLQCHLQVQYQEQDLGRIFPLGAKPLATTNSGSDATTTPTAPTTSSPTSTQTFSTLNTQTYTSGSGTWTNPYPSGASTGTGTLNGSAGTTHFIWGTSSGSYPNEVSATSNAYVRTTWPRGTTVYYKAKIINSSCAATFNGTVGANGLTTTVTFEYGTSTGVYGSSISATPGTVSASSSVTATATGLGAGTYYFRVKAVNAAGTTYGSEQSIVIAATSATASSEQSFTPPFIGTIYEALVVAGGGAGSMDGGGGGGVSASDSISVSSSLAYAVGGGGTNPSGGVYTAGDNSSLTSSGVWTMSATGGGGTNPYTGTAGSSGSGSGGNTYNSTSRSGGSALYGCVDGAGGGGGGAESAGQSGYYTPSYVGTGGYGGAAKSIYSISCSSGGGGEDIYGDDGYQHGNTPASTYGGGGAYNRTAQAGVVRFKYYGPQLGKRLYD